jgi:hypothetical protein
MQRHPEVAQVFTDPQPARVAKSSAPRSRGQEEAHSSLFVAAAQGNPTKPIRALKQGVIDQFPEQRKDFCGVPSGFRSAKWSPRCHAITCVKSFWIRNLNLIAVSHNVAGVRETALLGAGGRWFESSRPDQ